MEHMQTRPRELTQAEIEQVSGGYSGETIVVTGYRNWEEILLWAGYGEADTGVEPHPTLSPDGGGGGDPTPTPPDIECLTEEERNALSPEAREAYDIAVEAAAAARDIMSMPDRDTREYGVFIFRDANGVITRTALIPGEVTSVQAMAEGIPNMGDLLAIVHSHPAITYGADAYGNYDFKLYPTPGSHGDWAAFDSFVQRAYNDLISRGQSHDQAMNQVSKIHQFIVGPTAPAGHNQYEIRKYGAQDRDTVTLGQKVSMSLGQCH